MMQQKRNYQKELEALIEYNQKNGIVPKLYLHACCAPCSSYCLEYLLKYFKITVFYYNPNISPVHWPDAQLLPAYQEPTNTPLHKLPFLPNAK